MSELITLADVDEFSPALRFDKDEVSDEVLDTVRSLHESKELEPWLRSILSDVTETPHGPTEISDILTHRTTINGQPSLAAFILKGRSYQTVRASDVGHQIHRLERLTNLTLAVFAATGDVLDPAKEHFLSTAGRASDYYMFLDALDLARLFLGFGFICPRDGRKTSAGRCDCGYSPAKRVLNPLQKHALSALDDARTIGQEAALVVLPPGSGKTRVAAKDARTSGAECILYIAHRHEILDVAESEFIGIFGESKVTRHEDSASFRSLNTVNLATIQLLQRHTEVFEPGEFDYIVVDEFHHAAAPTYRKVIDEFAPIFLLGLTATPYRSDRQDITELCNGNVVADFELRTGINYGLLTPYHYYGCFDDVDYSDIQHDGERYDVRDLERHLVIPERDEAIIGKWRELAEGKPTVAFCVSHRHARRIAERFSEEGISVAEYISKTDRATREQRRRALAAGDVKILTTVDVLNEGVDFPYVECLLFLRPTESARIFYQQLGRGLRKYPGKSHCIVIDFIGNFQHAYRIPQYHSLLPYSEEDTNRVLKGAYDQKEILNLPVGCKVHFEDEVLDIFATQALDPARATRHNIGRILYYQYRRLERRLARRPSKKDVDQNLLLHSGLYTLVFGSWSDFRRVVEEDDPNLLGP